MTTKELFTRTHGKQAPLIPFFTKEDIIKFADKRLEIEKKRIK